MTLADQTIYLASKSPRRRELLQQVGIAFEVLELQEEPGNHGAVSEIPHEGEVPEIYVVRVAREKADSGWAAVLWRHLPKRPVLAADTTVTIDGKILGKPTDHAEAMAMLRLLSGRPHQVLTAVAVRFEDQVNEVLHRSEVRFSELSEAMLKAYCDSSEPYDKAGSYGIQGHAAQFIEHISGSHSGIMGLPLFETTRLLQQAGIRKL
jgi:septum formation protein